MAFLTSVAGSGTAKYFADENGAPYLLRWDTPWGLIVNAGNSGGATTWQSDMDGYCAIRAGQGFNGFLGAPVMTTQAGIGTNNNGQTWDGVLPFTSPGVLNDTFWQRVDYLLASAASHGMTVVLNVMFYYAIGTSGGPLNGWTDTQYGNYGTALGTRYAAAPNLVWEFGDDYPLFNENFDSHFDACLAGIRGAGDTHLISIETVAEATCRYSQDGTKSYPWGIANAQFDWVYSYNTAYNGVEDAYTEAAAHTVPSLCVCRMDGWYDNMQSQATETVELFMRKSVWWSLSSGSRGYMYGNNDLITWPTGALGSNILAGTGGAYMLPSALNTIWNTFSGLQNWHQLVPDTTSALVTAGRGTRSTEFGTGGATVYNGAANTYVSASKTADGTLAVIYIPSNVTITVNGGLMAAGYGAKWIDPASGAATTATIASTYSNPAANSAGDHDWLLVLAVPPYATWAVP